MNDRQRATARDIAREYLAAGDPLGWFDHLYVTASEDAAVIPWADSQPNANLVAWLDDNRVSGNGRALKVGSGLGDDAEELARRGFETTAFDISPAAVDWSVKRFPGSGVSYRVADLFRAPAEWTLAFDFVLESYTLQVLPHGLRADAAHAIASFVAPGGTLLVITRGREPDEPEGRMPWPLILDELAFFESHGLERASLEDYVDDEMPPVRRFRAVYRRAGG